MKNLIYGFTTLLLLTAAQCQKGTKFPLGEEFQLKIGASKTCDCGDLDIAVLRVKEDSRCPEFTNCIWEGQAIIEFALNQDEKAPMELILRKGHPQLGRKIIDDYSYTITKVEPYPKSGTKIPEEEYVISLRIEKIRS